MLPGTHVDDFLLASTSLMLAQAFALYFGKQFTCKMSIASESVVLHIIRDLLARLLYLAQALLLDWLLGKDFWVL